jgi:hypothetical protein
MSSTYFGLLAGFGKANITLDTIAPKDIGLSNEEARYCVSARLSGVDHRQSELLADALLVEGVR